MELYFKQCSLLVDCRDLALMAATLANGGAHPVTGQRAVAAKHISSRLSVMATCGIYDFTGEWVFRAGLPAKSGVGGGILAVLAGAAGHRRVFAAARRARQQRARRAGLASHLGRVRAALPAAAARGAGGGAGTLHAGPRALAPPAPARRNQAARRTRRCCPRVRAGGDLRFATIEPLLREIVTAGDTLQCPMLDFKRVAHVDAAATRLLARLIEGCAARGQQVVLSHVRRGELLSGLGAEIDPRRARAYSFHAQLDLGLEACERGLLARHGADTVPAPIAGLAQHRLSEGVAPEDVTYVQTQVQACSFDAGDTLVRRDDAADALFFILRGVVSVVVPLPQGGHKRLATLSAGMAFSETVLISGGRRSADVNADAPVEWLKLSAAAFAQPEHERPLLVVRLLHNLRLAGAETTARLTREVTALEG